jgi:Leucine-rich repeat (LRR) protein
LAELEHGDRLAANDTENYPLVIGIEKLTTIGAEVFTTRLAELKNLKTLCVYNSQVSDLSPLAGLTNLEALMLDNSQVSDRRFRHGVLHLQPA